MSTFARDIAEADDDTLQAIIRKWMNVKEIVSFAVVDRVIRNDDGPFHWYVGDGIPFNHNYYWYEDPIQERLHLIPWDLDSAFENIIANKNPVTPIADAWGEVRENCNPFNYGMFNIPQRSAACDKLTRGWASFEKEYEERRRQFIEGPLSKAQVDPHLDAWVEQIRSATEEASATHGDAITVSQWEAALSELRTQLEHARRY